MYHIRTTHAFVLNIWPSGERHNFITLFTREFGMIRAKAQSVRSADSKLRYALQEFSYIEVSLVKGKDIWRITNALPIYNIYFELRNRQNIFIVIAKIFVLLRRLMPEDGCESLIFNDLENVCKNVQRIEYTERSIQTIEWLFILRMMCFLGYSHKKNFANLCEDEIIWTNEYLDSISLYRNSAITSINNALEASHL